MLEQHLHPGDSFGIEPEHLVRSVYFLCQLIVHVQVGRRLETLRKISGLLQESFSLF